MSTSIVIECARRILTNLSTEEVEWPITQTVILLNGINDLS